MAYKKVNWPAIKKRYLLGEKPKDIGPEFGLTAKQISDKAKRDDWKRKKDEISEKVENSVQNDLKELVDITIAVHREFMQKLRGQMQDISNPYLFDGERTNSLFQTAMNNATKLTMATFKGEDQSVDEEPAGFNVSQDA